MYQIIIAAVSGKSLETELKLDGTFEIDLPLFTNCDAAFCLAALLLMENGAYEFIIEIG